MDFLDADEVLLRAALLERSSENASLSIHRLVQAAALRRLSSEEKTKFFDRAIGILGKCFPDTYSFDVGHQFMSWAQCERTLPHVNYLVKQTEKHKVMPSDPEVFAELLLRCCWYLYEREHCDDAKRVVRIAIKNFKDTSTLAYASAIDLLGLLELDTNNLSQALESFETALKIRQDALGPDDVFITSSLNNISLAYTELNGLPRAVPYQQKAIDIRLRTKSDRIGNSYSNMSSLLLRMGKADEAEEMLGKCPSLKDFNDETFLNTGNPRFSGDMVLLSRIRMHQGGVDDVIRLASKVLAFRQALLGNRLKTCDSIYQVADLLYQRGNSASAIELLEECVSISESIPEAEGYLARAKFKLSKICSGQGRQEQSQLYRREAVELKHRLCAGEVSDDDSEESYDRLVLWMLW